MAEAKIHPAEDTESKVNDEQNNPRVKQEKRKKENGKRNGKVKKKKKDIEFKCSKRPTSNQKQLSDLGTDITHFWFIFSSFES